MSAPLVNDLGFCMWWALCVNPATQLEPHPIIGDVPICDRCKAKLDAIDEARQRPAEAE